MDFVDEVERWDWVVEFLFHFFEWFLTAECIFLGTFSGVALPVDGAFVGEVPEEICKPCISTGDRDLIERSQQDRGDVPVDVVVGNVEGELIDRTVVFHTVVVDGIDFGIELDVDGATAFWTLRDDTALLTEDVFVLLERRPQVVTAVVLDAVRSIVTPDKVPDTEWLTTPVEGVFTDFVCFVEDRQEAILLLFTQETKWKSDPGCDAFLFAPNAVEKEGKDDEPKVGFGFSTTGWEPKDFRHIVFFRLHRGILPGDDCPDVRDDVHHLEGVPRVHIVVLLGKRLVHQGERAFGIIDIL